MELPRIKTNYKEFTCPVKNASAIIGDYWILFILREFLWGKPMQGFNELQRYLSPISSRTLAKKLKYLQAYGIVKKQIISLRPPKVSYSLTKKGISLKKPLQNLADWYK